MARPRKDDSEVSTVALWYRRYREQKKNGTYKPNERYTPKLTKEYLVNELGLEIDQFNTVWQTNPKTGKTHRCPVVYANTGLKYLMVNLTDYPEYARTKSRSSKKLALHRIIYVLKIGNIPLGMTVDHKDGDIYNNSIDNLQLITRSENTKKR